MLYMRFVIIVSMAVAIRLFVICLFNICSGGCCLKKGSAKISPALGALTAVYIWHTFDLTWITPVLLGIKLINRHIA